MARTNYYAGYYLIYDIRANSIYVGTSMNAAAAQQQESFS